MFILPCVTTGTTIGGWMPDPAGFLIPKKRHGTGGRMTAATSMILVKNIEAMI
jgi:hypothetical protein